MWGERLNFWTLGVCGRIFKENEEKQQIRVRTISIDAWKNWCYQRWTRSYDCNMKERPRLKFVLVLGVVSVPRGWNVDEFAANGSRDKIRWTSMDDIAEDFRERTRRCHLRRRRRRLAEIWSRSYVVRLDSDVRAKLDYAAGLLAGVIEEVGVGCDRRAAAPRRAGRDRSSGKAKNHSAKRGSRRPRVVTRIKDQWSRYDDFSNSPRKYS